jgi:serine/threonine-protein kinase
LVARLDAIRLGKAAVVEGKFDRAGADQKYAAAFAETGLAREGEEPGVVAARVRASAVSGPLVSALDDWAASTGDVKRRAWLLEVARKADPDRWRDRAREPAVWRDRKALEGLLAEEEATDQSPQLVVVLSSRLRRLGGNAARLLGRVQPRHPDDFWLDFELGDALAEGEPAEAAGYCRAALALRPDSSAVHNNLGNLLRAQGKAEGAEQEYRAAIRLDPKYAYPHYNLGNLLRDRGKVEEAEQEYRTAIRLDPKYAYPHYNLGLLLSGRGRAEEAEQEYRAAIRLDPKDAPPHICLGNLLWDRGKVEEAEQEYRAAIRLDPKYALPHYNLGNLLRVRGKAVEAEQEYRAAIRLDPKYAPPHYNLGNLLRDRGKVEEAEQEYRTAARLGPKDAPPHNGLGVLLRDRGKAEEAEQEYRAAIRLDPKYAPPHYNLGVLLTAQGHLEEAKSEYQQALELGFTGAREGLRQCERLRALTPRLPAVLRGDDRPSDAQEMLGFAELCRQPFQKRLAGAARFYGEAFAADPKVADDLRAGHRYNAACYAALAGCGQGNDADQPDAKEKARLRGQALDWLKADLALWASQAESNKPEDRTLVQQTLGHWKQDTDLTGVRGDALANLAEDEREPWRKLWEEVDALLSKVGDHDKKP